MCTLQAHMQGYDRFFEVFSNEVDQNELMLENIFSQLLIDFFEWVMVEVHMHFSPQEEAGMKHCNIHLQAQCDQQVHASTLDTDKYLEVRIEHEMCSILRELFCSVIVDSVRFFPSPRSNTFARSSAGKK